MGGKCDLRDVGGVAGLCISEVDDLLGFSCTVVCSVYNEWCKEKEKKSSERLVYGQNHLVNERGQR